MTTQSRARQPHGVHPAALRPPASAAACGAPRSARRGTRIALAPPPLDLIRSGLRVGDRPAQRQQPKLREVSTCAARAPTAAASCGGHHGGTSCSSATSHSQPRERARELVQQVAPGGRRRRGRGRGSRSSTRTEARDRTLLALAAPLPHRRRARRGRARRAARPRAGAQGAPRSPRARSTAARSRCCSSKPSTRTRVSFEAGVVELGGHPMVLRADELQLTRGESVRDTALRARRATSAAIGMRTGPDELLEELAEHATVPGRQHAHRRPPPVPGARRPADAARGASARSTG